MYEVVIAGGGPAGLSAALVLGRCRRRVLLCDAGNPRNASARALHGYLTRDGIAPSELIRLGVQELEPYGIEICRATVSDVRPSEDGFEVVFESGDHVSTQTVLLATGVEDELPAVEGIKECYGTSVHHCPYCDGWEVRDKRIVALGMGKSVAALALSLRTWSDQIDVCTTSNARLSAAQRAQLTKEGFEIHESRAVRIDHDNGWAKHVILANGKTVDCQAVFITGPQHQQSQLARKIGCEFNRKGTVRTDRLGKTCIPGIYVAGDASRDVQSVIVAAAEGAKAAVAINMALQARSGLVLKELELGSGSEALQPGGPSAVTNSPGNR